MAAKRTFVDQTYDWLDVATPEEVRDMAETLATATRLRKYPFKIDIKSIEDKKPEEAK